MTLAHYQEQLRLARIVDCDICGVVEHLPIPDDASHCPCHFQGLRTHVCLCDCHFGS
jgi:hypothetical protein